MELPESYNGNSKRRYSLTSEYPVYEGQTSFVSLAYVKQGSGAESPYAGHGERRNYDSCSSHPLTVEAVAEGLVRGIRSQEKRYVLENPTSSQTMHHGYMFQSLEFGNLI